MSDTRKFKIALFSAAVLVCLIFAYSIFQDLVMPDVQSYFQRRMYYDAVISKKGLSLHKALYWKEQQ